MVISFYSIIKLGFFRMSLIITDRFFDPMKYSNRLFHKTTMGTEYLQLKDKFYEISKKIIQDRKDAHLKNPDILKDTKNLSFLDMLLTVK